MGNVIEEAVSGTMFGKTMSQELCIVATKRNRSRPASVLPTENNWPNEGQEIKRVKEMRECMKAKIRQKGSEEDQTIAYVCS